VFYRLHQLSSSTVVNRLRQPSSTVFVNRRQPSSSTVVNRLRQPSSTVFVNCLRQPSSSTAVVIHRCKGRASTPVGRQPSAICHHGWCWLLNISRAFPSRYS